MGLCAVAIVFTKIGIHVIQQALKLCRSSPGAVTVLVRRILRSPCEQFGLVYSTQFSHISRTQSSTFSRAVREACCANLQNFFILLFFNYFFALLIAHMKINSFRLIHRKLPCGEQPNSFVLGDVAVVRSTNYSNLQL